MKTKNLLLMMISLFLIIIGIWGCEKISNDTVLPKELLRTWKLVGKLQSDSIGNYNIQKIIPPNINSYTLTFNDDNTITGRTIFNTFSANFELSGNKIIIKKFVCTEIGEKGDEPKNYLDFLSQMISFELIDGKLNLFSEDDSNAGLFFQTNRDSLFYYYQNDSVFFVLDTTSIYIEFNEKQENMNLVANYSQIDTLSWMFFPSTFAFLSIKSEITKTDYFVLLEQLNADAQIKYATPCIKGNSQHEAWTNIIFIKTQLSEFELEQVFETNGMHSLTRIPYSSYSNNVYMYQIDNIITGFEPLDYSNTLYILNDIEYTSTDNIWSFDDVNN